MALDDTQRLTQKIPNKYLLTLAVAERAKQILQSASLGDQGLKENPVILALREVDAGRVSIRVTDDQFRKALESRADEWL